MFFMMSRNYSQEVRRRKMECNIPVKVEGPRNTAAVQSLSLSSLVTAEVRPRNLFVKTSPFAFLHPSEQPKHSQTVPKHCARVRNIFNLQEFPEDKYLHGKNLCRICTAVPRFLSLKYQKGPTVLIIEAQTCRVTLMH